MFSNKFSNYFPNIFGNADAKANKAKEVKVADERFKKHEELKQIEDLIDIEELQEFEATPAMKAATLALTKVSLLPRYSELRSYQLEELGVATQKLSVFINAIGSSLTRLEYPADLVGEQIIKLEAARGPLEIFLAQCQVVNKNLSAANSNLEYNADVKHKYNQIPYKKVLPSFFIANFPHYIQSIGEELEKLEGVVKDKKYYIDSFQFQNHPAKFRKIHDILSDTIAHLLKEFAIACGDKGTYNPDEITFPKDCKQSNGILKR